MAATPPLQSFSVLHSNKPSHSLLRPSSNKNRTFFSFTSNLRCEIKGFDFESHRGWTIERVSDMSKESTNSHTNPSSPLLSVSAVTSASQFPTKNAKKVVLFYCAETKALAEKIAAETDAIELRSISWGFVAFRSRCTSRHAFVVCFGFDFDQCGDFCLFFLSTSSAPFGWIAVLCWNWCLGLCNLGTWICPLRLFSLVSVFHQLWVPHFAKLLYSARIDVSMVAI